MIMLKNKKVIMRGCDVKNSNRASQQSFSTAFHFTDTKISEPKFKICRALLPNVPILFFLRNCCNAQVTVSFFEDYIVCTFINSSVYTSVVAH